MEASESRSLNSSIDGEDSDVAAVARMARMQQRFQRIMSSVQADSDEEQDTEVDDTPMTQAATRWAMLRGTIGVSSVKTTAHVIKHSLSMKSEDPKTAVDEDDSPAVSPRPQEEPAPQEEVSNEQIDLQFWEDTSIPQPGEAPRFSYLSSVRDEQHAEDEKQSDTEESKILAPQEVVRSPSILDQVAPISDYEVKFATEADTAVLELSRIPAEVVEAEALAREAANLQEKQRLADLAKRREADLLMREEKARLEVIAMEEATRKRLLEEKRTLILRNAEREKQLGREFRRAKEELELNLRQQQATMKEVHGDVIKGENLARRFQVSSDTHPQPIEMRVHQLRAVKNKLPKGAYVLLLTQYDHLGGSPLSWSQLGPYGIGDEMPAVTKPVKHMGRYFDRIVKFDDSIYALCPPRAQILPSNVFILELFQLATRQNPYTKPLAWTALPIANDHFTVIHGKYRLPLLRGQHSPSVQQFKVMENLIGDDLSAWLCNLYIEIRHLPRDILVPLLPNIKKEPYDVEFDFINKMVLSGRKPTSAGTETAADASGDLDASGKSGIGESSKTMSSGPYSVDKGLFHRRLAPSRKEAIKRSKKTAAQVETGGFSNKLTSWISGRGAVGKSKKEDPPDDEDDLESGMVLMSPDDDPQTDTEEMGIIRDSDKKLMLLERDYDEGEEFYLYEFQKGKLAGVDTVNGRKERQWAAAGLEGNVMRRAQADGARYDSEAIDFPYDSSKAVGGISAKHRAQRAFGRDVNDWATQITDDRDYDLFTMSLAPDPAQRTHLLPSALVRSKLRFLYAEALGDLSPDDNNTFDFSVTFFVFVIAFWLRMYAHYVGQYLYLGAVRTPVYGFDIKLYEIVFKYMSSSIPVSYEFGMVAMGPISNVFIFICITALSHGFYKYAGNLPESVSKFVAAYGIATFFDPLLIFLVDIIAGNYNCKAKSDQCKEDYTSKKCECFNGDFSKMWYRMEADENSGVSGLVITLMIYTMTSIITALVLYIYLVYIYKNARILDIWRRLTAPTEEFFIPHDFEISMEELNSIVTRAEKWRGPNGSSRKLVVSEYHEKDPYDLSFADVTKHFVIYEHSIDGRRTMYRQFLLLPDGSIIEVFDSITANISQKYKALEQLLNADSSPTGASSKKKFNIFAGMENI